MPIYDAKDWVSIAKHMGGDVTNEQCRNRWCCKVDPSLNACKMGAWEPEEVRHTCPSCCRCCWWWTSCLLSPTLVSKLSLTCRFACLLFCVAGRPQENQLRELIQQYTNHPEQDKRGRRRYRDSVHWGAVAKVSEKYLYCSTDSEY